MILLCIAIPKVIFTIVSITGKGVSPVIPYADIYANSLAFLLAILAFLVSVYGFTYGWKKFTIKEVNIKSPDIPISFNGYKIVQLSDLHIGTFKQSPKAIKNLVNKVNNIHPDIIVFTGDIINSSPKELEPFVGELGKLRAKYGVYSVLGNHDYCEYEKHSTPLSSSVSLAKLIKMQEKMGWKLLMNDNAVIKIGDDSLAIIGVENEGLPPFPSKGDINKALEGVPNDAYKVLLTHDPTHWKKEIINNTNIQLSLSGHTHAMQFKIGKLSPSMLTHKEWGGLYTEGNQKLYVNTGTGGNVSYRVGAWPEITLLNLAS